MSKKFFLFIILVFQIASMCSQKVINMEPYAGVYRIPCKINGAKMKMIFDTGASSVSLSLNIAQYLYENDYISKDDIMGKSQTITANGDIVDNVVINLRDIEIDDIHLRNVKATVLSSQNAPLLLGLSAIQKLGSVTIEGNRLKINRYENKLSEGEIDNLFDEAYTLYNQKKYYAAADIYNKLRDNPGLSTYGYEILIDCLNKMGQYNNALSLFKEWENGKEYNISSDLDKLKIYYRACVTCVYADAPQHSIHVIEKEIALSQKLGIPVNGMDYSSLADAYSTLEDFKSAIFYRKKAINQYLSVENATIADLYNGKEISNEIRKNVGNELYLYALEYDILYNLKLVEDVDYLMKGAAKCGHKKAIDYCFKHMIKFTSGLYNSKFSYLFSSY